MASISLDQILLRKIIIFAFLMGIVLALIAGLFCELEKQDIVIWYLILAASALAIVLSLFYVKSTTLLDKVSDQLFSKIITSDYSLVDLATEWLHVSGKSDLELIVSDKLGQNQFYSFYIRNCTEQLNNINREYSQILDFGSKFNSIVRVRSTSLILDYELKASVFSLKLASQLWVKKFGTEAAKLSQLAAQDFKSKAGFLANLSHEIRAPLAVILNATELVLDGLCGPINENQKKFLGLSKKSSDHLLDLIGDVLDYAKIEAGKISPQIKVINLDEVIRDISNIARLLAESKKIEVKSHPSAEQIFVCADKKHLRQILINLTTNAIKYTQDGGSVEIEVEKIGASNIKIKVSDTGVGIAESEKHKVFKPFERLEDEYSKQQGGVGIGLSLAKKLAELNNGKLDFTSVLGRGSTFFILLPCADPDAIVSSSSAGQDSAILSSGQKLLLVESDPDQLEIVSAYLSNLNYNVVSSMDFTEAKDILSSDSFSALIVDNQSFDQSVTDRQELTELLGTHSNLPIILLSSRAFVFDLERYLKLGVERCLPKPAPLKELAGLVHEIIIRKQD
jgi:signal transduction histidine kinase